jgi:hypothetical protein
MSEAVFDAAGVNITTGPAADDTVHTEAQVDENVDVEQGDQVVEVGPPVVGERPDDSEPGEQVGGFDGDGQDDGDEEARNAVYVDPSAPPAPNVAHPE